MTEMRYLDHSAPIEVFGGLEDRFLQASLTGNGRPFLHLPNSYSGGDGWGGPHVDDLLTIDLSLDALSLDPDSAPVWRGSFRDLVLEALLDSTGDDDVDYAETFLFFRKLSDAIRCLADELDVAVNAVDPSNPPS